MEYINGFFALAQDNQLAVFLVAIGSTFIESFIPALPLIGIVMVNGITLGFWGGIFASCIGSCLGTTLLFLLARKFGHLKYFEKYKSNKTTKIINWVKSQNNFIMVLCYSCPFIPGCLVSITSGFCNKALENFIPGMIVGKLILFTVASYIGDDIFGFLGSPIKIAGLCLLIIISFLIGKRVNSKMQDKNTFSNELI